MLGCETAESVAHQLCRGKQRVPALGSTAQQPDIKWVQAVEDFDDELDRQSVERVTGVGYGSVDKLQAMFVLADSADQAGEAGRGSVLCEMNGILV
jgi:hypothetical protein